MPVTASPNVSTFFGIRRGIVHLSGVCSCAKWEWQNLDNRLPPEHLPCHRNISKIDNKSPITGPVATGNIVEYAGQYLLISPSDIGDRQSLSACVNHLDKRRASRRFFGRTSVLAFAVPSGVRCTAARRIERAITTDSRGSRSVSPLYSAW